jgi:ATP-dependent RNA helicase SUPV3L1/SUV3
VEGLGVLPREQVASEVKELDQDSRGALRKHGVRFGQFTIFMPLLLKPAPTRLRLVLWSLFHDLTEFPESPPPGLVTIPYVEAVPKGHYTLAGYHPAGARAIRIDMLERLADLLRARDSRAGFEAAPEMLSITGLSLEQFVDLMTGLGYKGTKGERVKVKAAAAPVVVPVEEIVNPIPEEVSLLAPVPEPEPEADVEEAAPEMEVFYTFTWAPKPRADRKPYRPERAKPAGEGAAVEGEKPRGDRPRGDGSKGERPKFDRPRRDKPQGDGPKADRPQGDRPHGDRPQGERPRGDKPRGDGYKGKGKPEKRDDRPKYEARPPRVEKPIDPDNPFAALLALKGKV